MTVLKHQSILTTGGAGENAPGLTITSGPSAPASQLTFLITDYLPAPIFYQASSSANLNCGTLGDRIGVRATAFGPSVGTFGRNGAVTPAALQLNVGLIAAEGIGLSIWSGTGVPSGITGATIGDVYLRRDTPTTANQRLYRYTGSWVGVL